MKKQTIGILLAITVVLGLVAFAPQLSLLKKTTAPKSTALYNFATLTEETTTEIKITQGPESRTLKKEGNEWKINEHIASPGQIDEFFTHLKGIELEQLVSKNKENFPEFGVTPEEGYTLEVKNQKDTPIFMIGNSGPLLDSFYISQKEGSEVYLAKSGLRDKLVQGVNNWRDKTMVKLTPEQVGKIEIVGSNEPLTLTKNTDNSWTAQAGTKTASLTDVQKEALTQALAGLEALDLLNSEQTQEFKNAPNKMTIRISDANAAMLTELTLLKKDPDWWVSVSGKDTSYLVPEYTFSSLIIPYTSLFK